MMATTKLKSLTTKIILIGIAMLAFTAAYIATSYIFTNQIHNNAMQINLAGSLRVRSFEMAWLVHRIMEAKEPAVKESLVMELKYEINMYERIADNIKNGNKELGIKQLRHKEALSMLNNSMEEWDRDLKPLLLDIIDIKGKNTKELLARFNMKIQSHSYDIDRFTGLLEADHVTRLKDFNKFRLYTFGLLVALTAFVIFYARRSIINPARKLKGAVKEIANGNFNARVKVKSDDDIGELSMAFNKMAAAINDRDTEKDILFRKVASSQRMWQETFDSITDLISVHDKDFNIIRANRAFAEYFGFHPRDVINKKCYEIFHKTKEPPETCPHITTIRENRTETVEMMNLADNRIFLITTFPFSFPEADFKGTIHVARDITEEKEKEMRLIMSDRLAALGQLASGIAHEINNPLSSIAGCAEGLLNRVKTERFDPALFNNYLTIIQEEILRCKNITTNMLSFVRGKTYEKKKINLNDVLDRTLEIIGFQGRLKTVKVIKNYDGTLPVVYGSEGEMRQVFMAIITNALDAMDRGGTLTLETGVENDSGFVKIGDTGKGISSDNIGRIFTPFFTTKSENGGTGLGLSIAKKIIADNKGNIFVGSEEGKGTTFKITIPV